MVRPMKYAIVLPDGAADEPVGRLGGRTPLQAAHKPNIDWVARNGLQGCVVTVPTGFSAGSDVATLSLLGYDPRTNYAGRAPLEAAAQGIHLSADELVFRCNFVTIVDGAMEDFTAGHIGQAEADRLIDDLNESVGDPSCRFHSGVSYRNLMVTSRCDGTGPQCTPPHDIPGQAVVSHLPRGPSAEWIRGVMERGRMVLADHEVNQVRHDLGENQATDIWLWGQGPSASLEPFQTRHGVSSAVIAAVDLIRGIARCAGMTLLDVPGATGYLDTDYAAKGQAAVAALDSFDLVIVHVEAPDEAGHLGDADAKVAAIERIDEHIVGPVLRKLQEFPEWRILIAPDHPTPVDRRVHTAAPPPYCIAGSGVAPALGEAFSELAAAGGVCIDPGCDLIRHFLER